MRDTFVTKRAFLFGMLCCVLIPVIDHYSTDVVHASYMAIDHIPVVAVGIFFFVALFLNACLRRIHPALAFGSGELLLVYAMMLVACSVTEMGLGSQILPILAAPFYYATSQNEWATLIQPHLKKFLVPQDPVAIAKFFEGLEKGGRIPWEVWAKPLAVWIPFLLVLYFVMFCIAVILRKQWMERERLVYPLAVLPQEMAKQGDTGIVPPFFKNRAMWIGFGIAFVFGTWKALTAYFPMVPPLVLSKSFPIFRGTVNWTFWLSFPVIGFSFFVNLDVAFSLWFFSLLFLMSRGALNMTGLTLTENLGGYGSREVLFKHVGMGAMAVMVVFSLWIARNHLKEVWRGALGRKVDDDAEMLPYGTAFWGMVVGLLLVAGFLVLTGMSVWMTVVFLLLALVIWLTLTRVVCEGGIPTLVATTIAAQQLLSMFGASKFAAGSLVALALTYIYAADLRTFPLSAGAVSLKILEGRKRMRPVFWALMAALTVSIVTTMAVVLVLAYRYGGINLNAWYFVNGPQVPYSLVGGLMKTPNEPIPLTWAARAGGAAVMAGLMLMRQRFLWWPLHPIGFLIGSVWLMEFLWFSVFLAWLVKKMALRYGGARMYNQLKPFFLGLPLGLYTCALVWFFIDLCTGKQGNQIFWI